MIFVENIFRDDLALYLYKKKSKLCSQTILPVIHDICTKHKEYIRYYTQYGIKPREATLILLIQLYRCKKMTEKITLSNVCPHK